MTETPTIFVAFGVTGGLMREKILPSLYALFKKGDLPERFVLLGVSRKTWGDEDLRHYISTVVASSIDTTEQKQEVLEKFLQCCFFIEGDTNDESLFEVLGGKFNHFDTLWKEVSSKILYIALPPQLYRHTFENLRRTPFTQSDSHIRLMIEKPFGTSGKYAEKLNTILEHTFSERSIYRVDHYLAKESLQNLDPIDGTLVESIHVRFFETAGVERRGSFYDTTGALRDIGQNHMLEMLALRIREHSRMEALKAIALLKPSDIESHVKRAQYAGYQSIPGVALHSKTETYFRVATHIAVGKFMGVAVVLEGGKAMHEDSKEIVVTFKDGRKIVTTITENKRRGEYEQLIYDCMNGNQTLFVRTDEANLLWRLTDPIIAAWERENTTASSTLPIYQSGTMPKE